MSTLTQHYIGVAFNLFLFFIFVVVFQWKWVVEKQELTKTNVHRTEQIIINTNNKHKSPLKNSKSVSKFKYPPCEEIYKSKFAHREVSYGQSIDFDSFTDGGSPFVYDWFNAQSWVRLLSGGAKVYPNLVREFYAHTNFSALSKGVVTSWVRGKEIVTNEQNLSEVLHFF